MNLNSINTNSLDTLLDSVFQNSAATTAASSNPVLTNSTSSATASDHGHLSPFAQLMSLLQQLQQSNPAEYQTLAQKIAANLQAAAQTDQANGDTAGANQLSQLSSDFTTAATTGQLPNVQDLAQALGSSNGAPKAKVSLSQLDQLLASLQAGSAPELNSSQSQSPLSIILNTLSNG